MQMPLTSYKTFMSPGSPFARLSRIPSDVQEFLRDYPDMENNNPNLNANVEFYSNLLPCQPDELLIDDVHEMQEHCALFKWPWTNLYV
jgi:hypothetical protein